MGMLLRRHYIDNSTKKGVAEQVAPNTVEESVPEIEKVPSYEGSNEIKYTKTIINRTSTEELKNIACRVGIKDADSYTGSELKKMLISKLGL